jgi:hypothetical protein
MSVLRTRPAALKDGTRDGTRHPASATTQASRAHPSPGHTLAGSPPGNLLGSARLSRR